MPQSVPHPQMPPVSCPAAKDNRGHTAPDQPQGAGYLWGSKPQVPCRKPVSCLPHFGPGTRWAPRGGEARLGQRAGRSWCAGSGTANLPPAAAPGSQAILL